MSDFIERLIEEQKQLEVKIEKLKAFLQSDSSNKIDPIQLALLSIQLPTMEGYLRCLNERLGRL